jgi:hypothetical protein
MKDYICYKDNIENFYQLKIKIDAPCPSGRSDECGWTTKPPCVGFYDPNERGDLDAIHQQDPFKPTFFAESRDVTCNKNAGDGSCVSNGCTTGNKNKISNITDAWCPLTHLTGGSATETYTNWLSCMCPKLLEAYPTIDSTDVNKPYLDKCKSYGFIGNNSYVVNNSRNSNGPSSYIPGNSNDPEISTPPSSYIPGISNIVLFGGIGVLVLILLIFKK